MHNIVFALSVSYDLIFLNCTFANLRFADKPKVKRRLLLGNSRQRKQNETTKNLEVLLIQCFVFPKLLSPLNLTGC